MNAFVYKYNVPVTNFGYEWEVAEAKNVRTKYKSGSAGEITADIGVYMGLRGINVTLKGTRDKLTGIICTYTATKSSNILHKWPDYKDSNGRESHTYEFTYTPVFVNACICECFFARWVTACF